MAPAAIEWEQQRPLITQLYFVENKTLSEVRETLAQHQAFHATERMYKRRIQVWRLDKNNKAQEIRSALQVAARRQNDGLSPVAGFRIGRRHVDWPEIRRYLRRKKIQKPP